MNAAIGDLLLEISRLEGLTNTIESNAQAASTSATSASTSAGEASNNASLASASATKAQIWAEGTDIEVEGLLGEHSSKGWAEKAKRYATGNIIEALGYTPADVDALNALDDSVVKHTEQTLTSTQQAQVRTNIGAVSSAELTTGLATKQDVLTFDAAPTSGSSNPVTSDGIKNALDNLVVSSQITTAISEAFSNKIGTDKGSTTKGVYIDANGVVQPCTYSVAKDVPSDAVFTDHTYGDFVKSGSTAAAGLVPQPPTTAGTTKYLREDCTWQVPSNSNNFVSKDNGSLAVGSYALCAVFKGTVYDGSTVAGSDLCILYINGDNVPSWDPKKKLPGTWRNVSGVRLSDDNGKYAKGGLFQRTA